MEFRRVLFRSGMRWRRVPKHSLRGEDDLLARLTADRFESLPEVTGLDPVFDAALVLGECGGARNKRTNRHRSKESTTKPRPRPHLNHSDRKSTRLNSSH